MTVHYTLGMCSQCIIVGICLHLYRVLAIVRARVLDHMYTHVCGVADDTDQTFLLTPIYHHRSCQKSIGAWGMKPTQIKVKPNT